MGSARTLGARLDPQRNALNLVRLVFAALVIFGHAAPLGGYTLPRPLAVAFGEACVDGFFALSGYLITRSWFRRPEWGRFLWHRCLRIVPAFWACLIITAAVLAPLGTLLAHGSLDGYLTHPEGPLQYVARNSLLWIRQYSISGGPQNIPYPGAWDGSLWSLGWEFQCYLVIGALGCLGVVRNARWLLPILTATTWALLSLHQVRPDITLGFLDNPVDQLLLRLLFMFFIGASLYLYADHVPSHGGLAAVAAILLVASLLWADNYRIIGGVPLAYLALWVGATLPVYLGMRTDLSYGVYIYAFPMQQLLATVGLASLGWLTFALLGVVAVLPLAAFSWYVIERPALRLKNWTPGRGGIPIDEGAPPSAQGERPGDGGGATSTRLAVAAIPRTVSTGTIVMVLLMIVYAGIGMRGWVIP